MKNVLVRCSIVVVIVCLAGCNLVGRNTEVGPPKIIEPPAPVHDVVQTDQDARPLRVLRSAARPHLHGQVRFLSDDDQPGRSETWYWSASPDRYVVEALQSAVSGDASLRFADRADVWLLELLLVELAVRPGDGQHDLVLRGRWTWTDPDGSQVVGQREVVQACASIDPAGIGRAGAGAFAALAAAILEDMPPGEP